MLFNPSFESVIKAGDTLIAVGESANLQKLAQILDPQVGDWKKMNIEHRTSNIERWMGKDEETEELIKIFVTSIKTAEKKQK